MTTQQPTPPYFMVVDVESMGLHGVAFAVGWAVLDTATGALVERRRHHCDPKRLPATYESWRWVIEHCAWASDPAEGTCSNAQELRDRFWVSWKHWRAQGAMLAADCPWPVEANFLSACVADQAVQREWEGPYPLIDVASVRLAARLDPLGTENRLPDELPAHCPEADAAQSARLLWEALRALGRPTRVVPLSVDMAKPGSTDKTVVTRHDVDVPN